MMSMRKMIAMALALIALGVLAQEGVKPGEADSRKARKDDPQWQALEASEHRISDALIPLSEAIPSRPKPVVELGDKILGQGPIGKGFRLPTGAVWQPSMWLFGSMRSAVQTIDEGTRTTEWVNRPDLFGNLRLTGTERIVAGVRPLDEQGTFSGYAFEPKDGAADGWQDGANLNIRTLYFEGDLAELFPRSGRNGNQPKSTYFAVGRQPVFIQEGMLVNDTIDAVSLTRNNIPVKGTNNFRLMAMFGWNQVNRNDNRDDNQAKIYGIFTEMDTYKSTVAVDFAYVASKDQTRGSGLFMGASQYRQYGKFSTSLRANVSLASDKPVLPDGTSVAVPSISDGILLFGEVSWVPKGTDHNSYINFFWGIDEYSSAARDTSVGGPLGRAGLLFASPGIGRFKPGLGNRAANALGGCYGYQWFFNVRRQFILELGYRTQTAHSDDNALALGTRFQQAFGQHFILNLDGFFAQWDTANPNDEESRFGARMEFQAIF